MAEKSDAAIIVVGNKGMRADEREWFGNIPDRLSHKAASGVIIVYTVEVRRRDGDAMGGVAAGDAGSSGDEPSM